MTEEEFERWSRIKKRLNRDHRIPTLNEREIWWCSIGLNIGFEVYGKGEKFWRPVLILDKHNRHTFLGIPLGSTLRPNNRYFFELEFRGKTGSLMFSQARTLSSKRLSNSMGTLSETKFSEIKKAYIETLKT